jgi:hypothetical protein
LQGTFGSPSRRVRRPVRGVAHSHSPGYSQYLVEVFCVVVA